jgi:hypothetical protein
MFLVHAAECSQVRAQSGACSLTAALLRWATKNQQVTAKTCAAQQKRIFDNQQVISAP